MRKAKYYNAVFELLKEAIEKQGGGKLCIPFIFVDGATYEQEQVLFNVSYFAQAVAKINNEDTGFDLAMETQAD